MAFSRPFAVLLVAFASVLASGQQPAPVAGSDGQSSSSSSSKAAPVQNDQQPPTDQTDDTKTENKTEKKKESRFKRKLKEAAPSCIGIVGGGAKCRQDSASEEDQKEAAEEWKLRQHCRDLKDNGQPEDHSCVELGQSDSKIDTEVGDDYFSDKHYPSAENRFRLALLEDPTNSKAMLHLARLLEKTDRKSEAYTEYQNFLNTEPLGPDAKRAREALNRLRPYWTGTPSPQ